METRPLPVKMYCPFSNIEENVFFYPIQVDGEWYVDINSFNGCDNSWHCCQECENCKTKAYDKIFGREK